MCLKRKPPKVTKPVVEEEQKDIKIEEIEVDDNVEDVDSDESNVETLSKLRER